MIRRQLESTLDDRRAGRYGDGETQEHAGRWMLLSLASAAFVVAAVLSEMGAEGLAIAMAAPLLVFAGGIASGATWATYR